MLSGGAARPLGGGGLAHALCHQPGNACRPVITGTPGKTRIHNDPHAINGQAGLRNGGGQNHLAIIAFAKRRLLVGRIQASMQPVKLSRDPI